MASTNVLIAAILDDLKSAFNRHDAAGVLRHFASDARMIAPAGAGGDGHAIAGADAIHRFIAGRFAAVPDMQWTDLGTFVVGERALTEWRVRSAAAGIDMRGCDVWTFRDGKVLVKDTYLKQAAPAA